MQVFADGLLEINPAVVRTECHEGPRVLRGRDGLPLLDKLQQQVFDRLGYFEIAKELNSPLINLHTGEMVEVEVPHAHLHLVPINNADDLNFTRPKLKLSPEEMEACQKKILEHVR